MGLVYSALFFSLRMYGAVGAALASHRLLSADAGGADEARASERVHVLKQWAVLSALGIWESLGDPLLSWLPFYTTIKLVLFLVVVAPGAGWAPWVFDKLLRPSAEEGWRRVEQRVQPILNNGALVMEVMGADEEERREIAMLFTERKRRRAAALGGLSGAASGATSGAATPRAGAAEAWAALREDAGAGGAGGAGAGAAGEGEAAVGRRRPAEGRVNWAAAAAAEGQEQEGRADSGKGGEVSASAEGLRRRPNAGI